MADERCESNKYKQRRNPLIARIKPLTRRFETISYSTSSSAGFVGPTEQAQSKLNQRLRRLD
ncbi:hypothetical protein [Bradyrhizobium pachyrhizi]|uniref:hypothetical protein n=1 Tax=Bradyrhizobium pachyrhizi TaxID=280333 RepID=UPI00067C7124|nr:hypothetical protein [Bradyrhizobium pachyrhizi]